MSIPTLALARSQFGSCSSVLLRSRAIASGALQNCRPLAGGDIESSVRRADSPGLVLWLPRKWTREAVRASMAFRTGLRVRFGRAKTKSFRNFSSAMTTYPSTCLNATNASTCKSRLVVIAHLPSMASRLLTATRGRAWRMSAAVHIHELPGPAFRSSRTAEFANATSVLQPASSSRFSSDTRCLLNVIEPPASAPLPSRPDENPVP